MSISSKECCILNTDGGAWAFESLAARLTLSLGIDVSDHPRRFNYLLQVEDMEMLREFKFFIPIKAIQIASDKRLLAEVFHEHKVPVPQTRLIENFDEVLGFIRGNAAIASGALKVSDKLWSGRPSDWLPLEAPRPPNWPRRYSSCKNSSVWSWPKCYRNFCASWGDIRVGGPTISRRRSGFTVGGSCARSPI